MAQSAPVERPSLALTVAALIVSLLASAGSVWLSVGMGLQACPLCLYQRAFAFATLGVLALGLMAGLGRSAPLSLLVLPLAVGGVGVAGFHVYLEAIQFLECPRGLAALGSAPQQSLAVLTLLFLLVLLDSAGRIRFGQVREAQLIAAIGLGVVFAAASIKSAPPPKLPSKPYDEPLLGCRPAYRS